MATIDNACEPRWCVQNAKFKVSVRESAPGAAAVPIPRRLRASAEELIGIRGEILQRSRFARNLTNTGEGDICRLFGRDGRIPRLLHRPVILGVVVVV